MTRRTIDELGISMEMPEELELLSEEFKNKIYIRTPRPDYVYASKDIPYQFAFRMTTHKVPDSGMKSFIKINAALLNKIGPKLKIMGENLYEIKEENIKKTQDENDSEKKKQESIFHIGTVEFVSSAIDTKVYNIQIYISIEGQVLMGSATIPMKEAKKSVCEIRDLIQSIRIEKKQAENS